MRKLLSWSRVIVALCLFIAICVLTRDIVRLSVVQQERKYDNANINHMKYGLFSVNTWKDRITKIVIQEIRNFKLDNSNKEVLKKHIESQLDSLIDKVNEQIKESNKDSTKGWFKQSLLDFLVDIQDIKKGIPDYADTIVKEMTKDDTQAQFKEVIKKKVSLYIKKTFEKQDTSEVDAIIARTGTKDIEEAKVYLGERIPVENSYLFWMTVVLLGLVVALFIVSGYHRKTKIPPAHFFICLGTLFILLFAGVTCPMIDMEAKISKFGFMLMGHNIEFFNQTVYFQSKSILDVFWILIRDSKLEMKIVGVLMIMFSIVFPLLKLSSSIFYYYNVYGAQKRWWIKALVLKSGKWSMTDVQIVAIMMAYIGFNGMVTTQFETLRATVPDTTLISTNGTSLQIGFYIFLTYAILAMFFSTMISKKSPPLED